MNDDTFAFVAGWLLIIIVALVVLTAIGEAL